MPSDLKIATDIYEIREELKFLKDKQNGGFITQRHGVILRLMTQGADLFLLTLIAHKENKALMELGVRSPYTLSANKPKTGTSIGALFKTKILRQEPPEDLRAESNERLYRKLGDLISFATEQCKLVEEKKPGTGEKASNLLYRWFMNGDF